MPDIFRATQAFAFTDKSGTPRSICAGDLISADDPNFKGKEHLFEPVEVAAARAVKTETASAAPGELRTRSVAKKAPAKAAEPKPEPKTDEPKGEN